MLKNDVMASPSFMYTTKSCLRVDIPAASPKDFSEAARAGRHRFQYLPFGAGPRICIGAQFAMTEAMAILADWLAAWRFLPDRSRTVFPRAEVTLRPDGGLHLWIEPRKAA